MKVLSLIALFAFTCNAFAQHAVVLNSRDANLSVIDIKTGAVTTSKTVGKEPHHLYPSPDGKQLWVANAQSDDLVRVDPKTGEFLQRVKGIIDPYQLAFTSDNQWFVSIALRLGRVDIYKPGADGSFKLIKKLAVGSGSGSMPSHVVFSADNKTAFVTLQADDALVAIDLATQTVLWETPLGKAPAGLWLTPAGLVLVGIMGENYVQVVDPAKRSTVKKIITQPGAHAFRGLGDGKVVFVSNRDSKSISAIDMDKLIVLYDIKTDSGPDCMDVSADMKTLWVTNRWARKVSAIDIASRKTIQQYAVGNSPHGVFLTERSPLK